MGRKHKYIGGIIGAEPLLSGSPRPGVSNLGALGGDGASDQHWDDVTLLLNGEDATIADVSSASTAIADGNSVSRSTSFYKYGSGSLTFSDTVSAAQNYISYSGPTLSGDFTLETWWRPDALPTANGTDEIIWETRAGSSSYPVLTYSGYQSGGANYPAICLYANTGFRIASTTSLSVDTWYHIALVRSGGIYKLFVDGVSQGTWNNSTTLNATTHYIGRRWTVGGNGSYYSLNADLDDFRFTPGVARYTGPFDPPTASFPTTGASTTRPTRRWGGITGRSLVASTDEHWDDVDLLINGSGVTAGSSVTDLSTEGNDFTSVSTNSLRTTGPYGTTQDVLDFDGANDWLRETTASGDFKFGADDFTIEFWAKCDITDSSAAGLIDHDLTAGTGYNDYFVVHLINDEYSFWVGSGTKYLQGTVGDVQGWNHVAITRQGTSGEMFINGSSTSTTTSLPSDMTSTRARQLYIGRQWFSSAPTYRCFDGKMADVRITRGVARDIAPPTARLSPPEYTVPTTGVLSLAEHYQSNFSAWKTDIEYMIIAGGGSGGYHHGGGGGAGGVLYGGAGSVTYTGPFTLTVGAGGPQHSTTPAGPTTSGDNSEAFGLTAIGGGGGGSNQDGVDGGSGGGEGGYDNAGNTAMYGNPTTGQGYRGGRNSPNTPSYSNIGSGGGGGGAGGVGGNCKGTVSNRAGYGGIGITNNFLNTLQYGQDDGSGNYYVAGGGGAGGWNGFVYQGFGGTGGGGNGGYDTTAPVVGTNGLGGGGGGRQQGNLYQGAAGGSGAVLIRIPDNVSLTVVSGSLSLPTPTVSVTGYKDYKCTTVGTGTVSIG